jgi:hypothetical protein
MAAGRERLREAGERGCLGRSARRTSAGGKVFTAMKVVTIREVPNPVPKDDEKWANPTPAARSPASPPRSLPGSRLASAHLRPFRVLFGTGPILSRTAVSGGTVRVEDLRHTIPALGANLGGAAFNGAVHEVGLTTSKRRDGDVARVADCSCGAACASTDRAGRALWPHRAL